MLLSLGACNSTDCPLNSIVLQQMHFYGRDGAKITMGDTLTVTLRDSIILNRALGQGSVSLPMSYAGERDTLVFHYTATNALESATDTLIVSKTNTPHFVSLECGRVVYHSITDVKWTRRAPSAECRYAIDSIAVKNPEVSTYAQENLQIYFNIYK